MTKYQRSNPQSMLNDSDILDMRAAFAGGNVSTEELSDLYGIDRTTVARIVSGRSWTHVPSPKAIHNGKYEVYPDGRIRSTSNSQFLNQRMKDGQPHVELRANGQRVITPVAYLVAKAFIAPSLRSAKAITFIGDTSDAHFTNIAVSGKASV